MISGKPTWAYLNLTDLKEQADKVIYDLSIGMPDDGAIRYDILNDHEKLAYDLARMVRQYFKESR